MFAVLYCIMCMCQVLFCAAAAAVAKVVDSNKKKTSLVSSMLLVLVPWMQISKAVMSNAAVSFGSLMAVLAAGIALHLIFLAYNLTATTALRLGSAGHDDGAMPVLLHLCCFQHKSFPGCGYF